MIASSSRLPKHSFSSDGVEIAYFDTGEGDPVLCIHGFASTAHINWTYPGWVDTLTKAGRRVIALDNRGHGDSEKLYDPAAYHTTLMADCSTISASRRPPCSAIPWARASPPSSPSAIRTG